MKSIDQPEKTMKWMNLSGAAKRCAAGLAACAALLAGGVRANTTITGTTTVTDPNTWTASAGTVTINNGATLQFQASAQGNYTIPNNFVLAGSAGNINLGFKDNDTDYLMTGTFTSTATGVQTLWIYTGQSTNGDRESATFNTGIPNVSDGSALGFNVRRISTAKE